MRIRRCSKCGEEMDFMSKRTSKPIMVTSKETGVTIPVELWLCRRCGTMLIQPFGRSEANPESDLELQQSKPFE